ncbi:3-oxoacyl-ACP reductase family protein [Paracoccus mutanolyticus]|uniref:3-oxoacyl-ACP reductase family protein n=1 Tax=Paracoccus mutanolyticus TaxID=1499308 RepID=UPI0021D5248A|nr:3-oxoacyl-ACP reductase family protein [Paracoccus mutanolyticus]
MFDLTGRNALVTGASGGIGGAVAEALHAAGATVTLSGTREAPLRELADRLGSRAHVVTANLGDAAAVEALPKAAAEAMGSVDILVNNAGITRDNLFMRMSDEEWAQVLEVNLTSGFRLCRAVLRGMMKARWRPHRQHHLGRRRDRRIRARCYYAAAKAGLVSMSKSLAYEVASRGITVNCVAPGFIETAMTDKLNDDQKGRILAQIPAGRMGTAGEIAAAVLYLSSAEAGYVTGATLHVNGGMAMI